MNEWGIWEWLGAFVIVLIVIRILAIFEFGRTLLMLGFLVFLFGVVIVVGLVLYVIGPEGQRIPLAIAGGGLLGFAILRWLGLDV